MNYCHKEDLFDACLQNVIEHWASDNTEDSKEDIYNRIDSAITRASEEMNLYLSKQYSLPLPFVPLSLRDICVKLSLYQLLSRKGFSQESSDASIKINYDSAIKQLEYIASGKLDIGIMKTPNPTTLPPFFQFPKSPFLGKKQFY